MGVTLLTEVIHLFAHERYFWDEARLWSWAKKSSRFFMRTKYRGARVPWEEELTFRTESITAATAKSLPELHLSHCENIMSDINSEPFKITRERNTGDQKHPNLLADIVCGSLRPFLPAIILRTKILTYPLEKYSLLELMDFFFWRSCQLINSLASYQIWLIFTKLTIFLALVCASSIADEAKQPSLDEWMRTRPALERFWAYT